MDRWLWVLYFLVFDCVYDVDVSFLGDFNYVDWVWVM